MIVLLALPALVSHLLFPPNPPKTPFHAVPLEKINKRKPRYVFIGNSMLGTRLLPTAMAKLTGNKVSHYLAREGTMTPYWYLALKNYICAAEHKPGKVFIFFRDITLTRALLRIGGRFKKKIDRVSHPEEPVFQSVVSRATPWLSHLMRWLRLIYPALKQSNHNRELVSDAAWNLAGLKKLARNKNFKKRVNQRFRWKHIRHDLVAERNTSAFSKKSLDFPSVLETSFLPHMIRLARENGIRLVFVRVQKRPLVEGKLPPQPEGLPGYIRQLRGYVEENGMGFYDFNGHPGLTKSIYSEGDHIAPKYRRKYTRLFYRYLKKEFR